ncbi:MAG: hypothetical protein JWM40_1740 [Frankiales bacterium]|nr:hypothetical protein [Frankiales bacterium]
MIALGTLGFLLLGALVLASPARAATRTVILDGNGPSPRSITINAGDKVAFVNHDSVSHTVSDNAGPWSFHSTIRSGGSATTPVFSAAGHYGYNDAFVVTVFQQNVDGSIEVRAVAPSPTPKPTATRTASPRPTATKTASPSASPSRSASPTATPAETATPSPSATLGTVPPTPQPSTSEPTPAVATPGGTPTVAYGPTSEIAQASAHRYGIPVLLALLAVAGVLSLLVRFLLAQPASVAVGVTPASRRTEGDGVDQDPS